MADATAAVDAMDSAARDLFDQLTPDSKQQMQVARLLLKLGTLIGGLASEATLAAMASATARLRAEPDARKFATAIRAANAASNAVVPLA